jgi:hypothetical protein
MVCYKLRKIDFKKSTDKREYLQRVFARARARVCVCVCVWGRGVVLFKEAASCKDKLIWAVDCCIKCDYETLVKYFCQGKTEEFGEF